jgi:hypothetical protein
MAMLGGGGGGSGEACPTAPTRVALGAVVAALVLDIVAQVLDLLRLRRLRSGATLDDVGLDAASTIADLANLALPLAVLAAAGTFVWWFVCAYRNLDRAGLADREPRWAVLGWLVPGLNLHRPPSMMTELVARPAGSISWAAGSGAILTVGWWALWIEGALIQVALRLVTPTTNPGWQRWMTAAIISDVVLIAAAASAVALTAMAAERQGLLAAQNRAPVAAARPRS